jgi:GNAT superfamily N-acetyltransferase
MALISTYAEVADGVNSQNYDNGSRSIPEPEDSRSRFRKTTDAGAEDYCSREFRASYNFAMLSIRRATLADVPLLLAFIRELAEYEREPQAAVATEGDLIRDGFSSEPKFRAEIAEWNGESAGFALYFFNYSTWLGRPGLYLEDLFVRTAFRGKGIGKALMSHLAAIAVRESCYGMRWQVLDWNTPSIEFYERLGAEVRREWLDVIFRGGALRTLAQRNGG